MISNFQIVIVTGDVKTEETGGGGAEGGKEGTPTAVDKQGGEGEKEGEGEEKEGGEGGKKEDGKVEAGGDTNCEEEKKRQVRKGSIEPSEAVSFNLLDAQLTLRVVVKLHSELE